MCWVHMDTFSVVGWPCTPLRSFNFARDRAKPTDRLHNTEHPNNRPPHDMCLKHIEQVQWPEHLTALCVQCQQSVPHSLEGRRWPSVTHVRALESSIASFTASKRTNRKVKYEWRGNRNITQRLQKDKTSTKKKWMRFSYQTLYSFILNDQIPCFHRKKKSEQTNPDSYSQS